MSGSVILNSPIMLILYGIALALCLFDIRKKTGFLLPFLSALIVVGTSAYALLSGAGLFETASVIAVFLLLNLPKKGEEAHEL